MRPVFSSAVTATLISIFILVSPVSATFLLTDVAFQPAGPLLPGGQQEIIAEYAVMPTGSTTFVRSHQIQMQTDLEKAQWKIQVMVDGQNTVLKTVSGNTSFVNGVLLSYSTDTDISFRVTIDGIVPVVSGDKLRVLRIEEIDDSGNVVSGSMFTISQPLAGRTPAADQTHVWTPGPTLIPLSSTPTKSPGFLTPVVIVALGIAGVFRIGKRKQMHT